MKTAIAITVAVLMSAIVTPVFACVDGTYSGALVCRDGAWHSKHSLSYDPKSERLQETHRRENFTDKQRHDLDMENAREKAYDKNHKDQ